HRDRRCGAHDRVHGGGEHRDVEGEGVDRPAHAHVLRVARAPTGHDRDVVERVRPARALGPPDLDVAHRSTLSADAAPLTASLVARLEPRPWGGGNASRPEGVSPAGAADDGAAVAGAVDAGTVVAEPARPATRGNLRGTPASAKRRARRGASRTSAQPACTTVHPRARRRASLARSRRTFSSGSPWLKRGSAYLSQPSNSTITRHPGHAKSANIRPTASTTSSWHTGASNPSSCTTPRAYDSPPEPESPTASSAARHTTRTPRRGPISRSRSRMTAGVVESGVRCEMAQSIAASASGSGRPAARSIAVRATSVTSRRPSVTAWSCSAAEVRRRTPGSDRPPPR